LGAIDNQKIKEFASSYSNALLVFKNKIRRQQTPGEIDKEENYLKI